MHGVQVRVVQWVLASAGARPAERDPVDARVVRSVREQTGRIIASKDDVGGWPKLDEHHHPLTLPQNPNGDDDGNSYMNVEQWLHSFAAKVERCSIPHPRASDAVVQQQPPQGQ